MFQLDVILKPPGGSFRVENNMIDDLIVGNNAVPEAEQGMQMGRMISLLALGLDAPGMVINRYCGIRQSAIAVASARFMPVRLI